MIENAEPPLAADWPSLAEATKMVPKMTGRVVTSEQRPTRAVAARERAATSRSRGARRTVAPVAARARGRRATRHDHLRDLQEVAVEDAESEHRQEPRQDPEADDDRGLGPTAQLEVVVERARCERPVAQRAES